MFIYLINTDLIAFVRNVITMMTANPKYPSLDPALADVTTLVNTFETTVHAALDGGKLPIATRNAAREDLLLSVRRLASYVQGACEGEMVALISSGFDSVKPRTPSYVPDAPGNQRLEQGGTGQLVLRFDRVSNANNYSIQSATSPDGPWEDRGLSTTTRVTIDNLTPGKVYWARACANGANGAAGSSDFGGPATECRCKSTTARQSGKETRRVSNPARFSFPGQVHRTDRSCREEKQAGHQ